MDIWNQYEQFVLQSSMSRHSKRSYLSRIDTLKCFLATNNTSMHASLDSKQIEVVFHGFQHHLQEELELKGSSVNRYISTARHFISFLGLAPPPVKRAMEFAATISVLNKDEQLRMLETVKTSGSIRDRALVKIMLLAGIRPAECTSLRWWDLNYREEQLEATVGTSDKRRIVPLPSSLEEDILSLFETADSSVSFGANQQPIFVSKEGAALSPNALDRIIRTHAHRANLDIHCLALRHTCIANWSESIPNAFTVAELSGVNLESLAEIQTTRFVITDGA